MNLNPPLCSGEEIDKYTLIRPLGAGCFGDVWLVQDNNIDRIIALKIMIHDENGVWEARYGNLMDHPNLVKVHYADQVNRYGADLFLIAMDYQDSGSVLSLLNSHGFAPVNKVLPVIEDVLRGLRFLHGQDLYHNDIKPSNILIGSLGEGILTDYGISAFRAGEDYVEARSFYILHAAPEVIESEHICAQTDIYQVGLTMFRLLNGNDVLDNKLQVLGREEYDRRAAEGTLIKDSDYLPCIPAKLKSVIKKAMNKDPEERFRSPLDMLRKLESICFLGDWDIAPNGGYVGQTLANEFRFECMIREDGLYDFTAYKKNKRSGNEQRVVAFCKSRVSRREMMKAQKKFMQNVVTGG